MAYKKVKRREHCRVCGLTEAEAGGPISVQGYCPNCGLARARAAALSMKYKSGPAWEKWKKAQQAYLDSLR